MTLLKVLLTVVLSVWVIAGAAALAIWIAVGAPSQATPFGRLYHVLAIGGSVGWVVAGVVLLAIGIAMGDGGDDYP